MKQNVDDSAVSPVIGTILLVAITVGLAAIIAVVIMGMTGDMSSKQVGLTVTPGTITNSNDDQNLYFTVIIYGGKDVSELRSLNMSVEGYSPVYYILPPNSSVYHLQHISVKNVDADGYNYYAKIPVSDIIGRPLYYAPYYNNEDGKDLMKMDNALYTVIGTFSDGTEQVLYEGRITFERHTLNGTPFKGLMYEGSGSGTSLESPIFI